MVQMQGHGNGGLVGGGNDERRGLFQARVLDGALRDLQEHGGFLGFAGVNDGLHGFEVVGIERANGVAALEGGLEQLKTGHEWHGRHISLNVMPRAQSPEALGTGGAKWW